LLERRTGARHQDRVVAEVAEGADQPQRLPLAAAHLVSEIEVKDAHPPHFTA
jgi:hypothetical protein